MKKSKLTLKDVTEAVEVVAPRNTSQDRFEAPLGYYGSTLNLHEAMASYSHEVEIRALPLVAAIYRGMLGETLNPFVVYFYSYPGRIPYTHPEKK